MKKRVTTLLLAFMLTGGYAQENPIAIPGALFKVAPQNFINNALKVGAEFFSKSKERSYLVYLSGSFNPDNNDYSYYPAGIGVEFQYRKYIAPLTVYTTKRNKEYLQGIYVSGYVQGGSYSAEYSDFNYYYNPANPNQPVPTTYTTEESSYNYGAGFTIGFHRTLWKVLFIDAYLGGGLQGSHVEKTTTPTLPPNPYTYTYYDITDPRYSGVLPKFGLQIGVML